MPLGFFLCHQQAPAASRDVRLEAVHVPMARGGWVPPWGFLPRPPPFVVVVVAFFVRAFLRPLALRRLRCAVSSVVSFFLPRLPPPLAPLPWGCRRTQPPRKQWYQSVGKHQACLKEGQ